MFRSLALAPLSAVGYVAWTVESQGDAPLDAMDRWGRFVSNVGVPVAFFAVFLLVSAYAAWKIVPKIVAGMDLHMDSVRELRETARTNRDTLKKLEELAEKTDRRLEFLEKSVLAVLPPPGPN